MSKLHRSLVIIGWLTSFLPSLINAQDAAAPQKVDPPVELEVIRNSIGVWDCEFQVWTQGPDAAPMTFTGVEKVRAFGEYWLASDLESTAMGQTTVVHSVIGYDLDEKALTGLVIDQGPYSAKMEGVYHPETRTVNWTIHAKTPDGDPMPQHTVMTMPNGDERILVMNMPGPDGEMVKFMQVRYARRKTESDKTGDSE